MSHVTKKNLQQFQVTLLGVDFTFNVGRDDYNKYINSITQKEKVAPSHNFLMSTVAAENEEQLKKVLADSPGSEVQISADILEAYTPDLGIVVKKLSAEQNA